MRESTAATREREEKAAKKNRDANEEFVPYEKTQSYINDSCRSNMGQAQSLSG